MAVVNTTSASGSSTITGQLSASKAGVATNSFASTDSVSQVYVQSGGASFGAYTTYRRGTTSYGEIGTDSTKTGLYFGTYNPSFAYVGDVSLSGAWTFGPAGSFTASVHTFNGGLTINGNSTTLKLNKSGTGAALGFQASGADAALLIAKAAGGFEFYQNTPTLVGQYDNNGSWTIGPTSAIGTSTFVGAQIVGKTNATAVAAGYVGQVLFNSNTSTNQSSGSNLSGSSITLTPGYWAVNVAIDVGNVAPTNLQFGISTTAGGGFAASPVTSIGSQRNITDFGNTTAAARGESTWNLWNVSTNTQLWPTVQISSPVSSSYTITWFIWAIRIA